MKVNAGAPRAVLVALTVAPDRTGPCDHRARATRAGTTPHPARTAPTPAQHALAAAHPTSAALGVAALMGRQAIGGQQGRVSIDERGSSSPYRSGTAGRGAWIGAWVDWGHGRNLDRRAAYLRAGVHRLLGLRGGRSGGCRRCQTWRLMQNSLRTRSTACVPAGQ